MLWDDGSETWETLSLMATSDPMTLARYAKDNDLLEKTGWKHFKRIAQCEKKCIQMVFQACAAQVHNAKAYKFGVRIPWTYHEALEIDNACGDRVW